ncbi:hypothetical protein [Thauera aminoaromatica]|jgi:hypothetical protein|uniref:Uncharacterized protein n=1 Tax=Thauera aminoaromatica TaxID=164330 RepID=A0A5C7ST59_THASP|nr:hypothetical protein [Thauera aminoaromatica]TXH86743.1 MAG: hypothetical protein E6Q80_07060 [Thauera aminoaromatica]HRG70334.1 hypothetical protein [Thauera aminoaromatica]
MPTCPRCDGTDCRESPWKSADERLAHPGERAWRCMSCVHRFHAPEPRRLLRDNPIVATVGGSTLLLTIAVIAILWFWKS